MVWWQLPERELPLIYRDCSFSFCCVYRTWMKKNLPKETQTAKKKLKGVLPLSKKLREHLLMGSHVLVMPRRDFTYFGELVISCSVMCMGHEVNKSLPNETQKKTLKWFYPHPKNCIVLRYILNLNSHIILHQSYSWSV